MENNAKKISEILAESMSNIDRIERQFTIRCVVVAAIAVIGLIVTF